MNLFGLTILRRKEALQLTSLRGSSWLWGPIREGFTGAWQRNVQCESPQNILAFSAVYACVSLIANDISKLRIKLIEDLGQGTWDEVTTNSPFLPVLTKPNRYQTRLQFISHWMTSKLLHGNSYALKERDQRGVVTDLYLLDPRLVTPLVATDGSVYYRLNYDALSGIDAQVVVPAKEIIHDRMVTLWHPLIGVTPIFACGAAATQGLRIQANSVKFFENLSMPSGMLSAPGEISDETAARMKTEFNTKFGGGNIGRLLVAGNGIDYKAFTMPAADSQLIEQLRWTVEDVARCFLIPQYKIEASPSGRAPAANLSALNQDYYNQALQTHIESIELLLNEGLELPPRYQTEMDLDGLLRMDPLSQAETFAKEVGAGYLAPNEARKRRNLPPVAGGDACYLQQQNYSTEALAKRDAQSDPFASKAPTVPTPPALPAPADGAAKELADAIINKFLKAPAYA